MKITVAYLMSMKLKINPLIYLFSYACTSPPFKKKSINCTEFFLFCLFFAAQLVNIYLLIARLVLTNITLLTKFFCNCPLFCNCPFTDF